MNEANKTENNELRHEVIVEKVISYNTHTNFTYYYPRLKLTGNHLPIVMDDIHTSIDMIIIGINHLIETMVLDYSEFMELSCSYIHRGLETTIKLKDLLYHVFKEEYHLFLRPLLQLSTSWIQVDDSFDRYYLVGKADNVLYRINQLSRIEAYKLLESEITSLTLQNEKTGNLVKEQLVVSLTKNINSRLE